MNIAYKTALLFTSALGLLISAPALAQSSATPTPAPAPQQADQNNEGTGDIIVTARRIEERLQDVPISITVFNQQQLSNRNIVTPENLALYTPSLSTQGILSREDTSYAIRGFTQTIQTSPSVAVYFADVVAPRSGGPIPQGDGAGPGSFYDLQNVQILKGPQGTLFGRNTTGGAVLLVPQKPTAKFGGYLEGLYGSYNWKGIQGAINVPIADNLRARVAFDHQDRDGLTKDAGAGPAVDDRNYTAVRASLVWNVTPDIENYTILSYLHTKSHGSGYSLIACNPASFIGSTVCGPFATQQASGPHTISTDITNPQNEHHEYRAINTTTWRASDSLTIKNIVSFTKLSGNFTGDVFSTNIKVPTAVVVPIQDMQGNFLGTQLTQTGALAGTRLQFVDTSSAPGKEATDQRNFTEELQFQGRTGGGKFVWQAGLYYERSTPINEIGNSSTQLTNCANISTLQCYSPLGQVFRQGYAQFFANRFGVPVQFTDPGFDFPIGGTGLRLSQISYRNLGIYGQGTYALSDKIKVTGGLRYTSDKVTSSAEEFTFTFPHANMPVKSCIEPDASLANNCQLTAGTKSSKPTWLIDVDYKPSEDVLLYGKYARGYRQGSVSVDAASGYRTFKPEKVDAFEVGLKASLRGALRGYFNVDAFYNNLYGQQISSVFNVPPGSSISQADGIVNATKSRIYGLEAEANITPFTGFNLNGSYTYLNTKLISAPPIVVFAPFVNAAYSADIGGDLTFSPHNRFTLTASYVLPLDPSVGQVVFGATYSYVGSQLAVAMVQTPYGRLAAFNTLNLNLNWNHVGGSRIDLSAFATNVTNEVYRTAVAGLYNSTGFDFARYGEQRVVGGKARISF
jgi:iron complex outermembrane receptor protein